MHRGDAPTGGSRSGGVPSARFDLLDEDFIPSYRSASFRAGVSPAEEAPPEGAAPKGFRLTLRTRRKPDDRSLPAHPDHGPGALHQRDATRVERSGRGACVRFGGSWRSLIKAAPPSRTARRFAPEIETPACAGGALRRVPICSCFFVKGGVPPFHTLPPDTRAANGVRCHCFCSFKASTSSVERAAASSDS